MDLFDLTGKTALVTGASAGLGMAMAVALAEAGADIVGVATSSMDETAKAVEKTGRKFMAIQADLSTVAPVAGIVEKSSALNGRVDILVNNAGTIRRADAVDVTESDWDAVMGVNLKTVFFLCQAFARKWLADGKGGKIINVASMLSFQGGIRVPAYTASKSALAGLTKALANEWAKAGIRVNAIAPGYMETNNTKAIREDPDRSASILSRIPAGRWGLPEDMAGAVIFLSGTGSDYVTGHVLAVDGGWLAR